NASYHSRQIERLPTSWRKGEISEWLDRKEIGHDKSLVKPELLNIARQQQKFQKYVLDEMACNDGVFVHRLPPNHCELNPIDLIWAQVKKEVASRNTTSKLCDVKVLFHEAINNVIPKNWQKCIFHTQKEEEKMWNLDIQADIIMEPIVA
ncbi:uncharacterized protein, partial [Diabrotica undecimpunctata]|uniref:uncharacterized protein n=1 Tax=Diabrotica undecimpunctata TaxID=50387 RepID=UPI003B640093